MLELAKKVEHLLKQKQISLVTAESCTGGQVAEVITSIPGSSDWFERGYVTYSNAAKHECLGVPEQIINAFGAVSKETACAMAEGALQHSNAQVAIAVTGIAGPDGGSVEKPVGTVWLAWAAKEDPKNIHAKLFHFTGDRLSIRTQATAAALQGLVDFCA